MFSEVKTEEIAY